MIFIIIWGLCILVSAIIAHSKKLNVPLYVILSLFLGPTALIVVFLDAVSRKASAKASQSFRSLSVSEELNSIKKSLEYLQQRVQGLESRIGRSDSIEDFPVLEPKSEEQKALETKEGKEFEFMFGKYWLNRIGALILFFGIGFFISYAFKYLDAVAKVSIGYLFAISFFVCGSILEKKKNYLKISWGFLGLAWACAYLTTYAMYYIRATQIISNAALEMWLLAIVSYFAIVYNLKYRSWTVTFITFILAFITAGMGSFDYSTVAYCLLLTLSIVFIFHKMKWYNFMLFGILGVYLVYLNWIYPQLLEAPLSSKNFSLPVYQFQLSFGIILASWLIFSISQLSIRPSGSEGLRMALGSIMVNAAFFVFLGMGLLYSLKPHLNLSVDIVFWFLAILACIYGAYSYIYRLLGSQRLVVANICIAATLIAMAVFVKFPGTRLVYFWSLEMLLLFAIGIYYREAIYRFLGAVLSVFIFIKVIVITDLSLKQNMVVVAFVVLCFYLLGTLVRHKKISENIPDQEAVNYRSFIVAATFLLGFLLWSEVNARWVSLALTLQGIAILGIGLLLKDKTYRVCSLSVLAVGCLRLFLVDLANVNAVYKIVSFIFLGAILLLVSLIYTRFISKE